MKTSEAALLLVKMKAYSRIYVMVKPCTYVYVWNAKTAKRLGKNKILWKKGLIRKVGLIRMLFVLRLEHFHNTEKHVVEQLGCFGWWICQNDSKWTAQLILSTLLESTSVKIKNDLVQTKLLPEGVRRGDITKKSNNNN